IQVRPAEDGAPPPVPVRAHREHLRHPLRVRRSRRDEDGAAARSLRQGDIRLVKDMTVAGTLGKLRAHLEKRGFGDLRIEVHGPYGPAKTDPDSGIARSAIEAVQAHGKEPEVWPSTGGKMPAFAFDEYPHLPWVATGPG